MAEQPYVDCKQAQACIFRGEAYFQPYHARANQFEKQQEAQPKLVLHGKKKVSVGEEARDGSRLLQADAANGANTQDRAFMHPVLYKIEVQMRCTTQLTKTGHPRLSKCSQPLSPAGTHMQSLSLQGMRSLKEMRTESFLADSWCIITMHERSLGAGEEVQPDILWSGSTQCWIQQLWRPQE